MKRYTVPALAILLIASSIFYHFGSRATRGFIELAGLVVALVIVLLGGWFGLTWLDAAVRRDRQAWKEAKSNWRRQ